MKKGFFITGTDTGVGKTIVTGGLVLALQKKGYRVMPIKPLSSGAEYTAHGLCNEDGLVLKQCTTLPCTYTEVNPLPLKEGVAPHIAAAKEQKTLSVMALVKACEKAFKVDADYYCVEGVGGWLVPLNAQETMADFAKALGWPVIMVVGMRLGCLNHALLTYLSIKESHLTSVGWVANIMDPLMPSLEDNIETLRERLPVPLLGVIPHTEENPIKLASELLKVNALINKIDFECCPKEPLKV